MNVFKYSVIILFLLASCKANIRIENDYFEEINDFSIDDKIFTRITKRETTEYFNIKYGSYDFSFITASKLKCLGKVNIAKIGTDYLTLKTKEDGTTELTPE